MGEFATYVQRRLPADLALPDVLVALFDWLDDEGYVSPDEDGELWAGIGPGWAGPQAGTSLAFQVETRDERAEWGRQWFGTDEGGTLFAERLIPFARTGDDGSYAAFWRDDSGRWRIVHVGSGSGSLLTCVLAETAEDFLRLIAIGYDELCWLDRDSFAAPPQPHEDGTPIVHEPLRRWLGGRGLDVPATAAAIVAHPATMDDVDSPDPFCAWVAAHAG